MTTTNKTNEIITKIQNGKALSFLEQSYISNKLLELYKPHKIENYLYDQDELKAAYLVAAYNALSRAKLDVGDPLAFCANRGKGARLDYYRKRSSEALNLICEECHTEHSYSYFILDNGCKHCKAHYAEMGIKYITEQKLRKDGAPDCDYVVGKFRSVEKETAVTQESFIKKFGSLAGVQEEIELDEMTKGLIATLKSAPLRKLEKEVAIKSVTEKKSLKEVIKEKNLKGKEAMTLETFLKGFITNAIARLA